MDEVAATAAVLCTLVLSVTSCVGYSNKLEADTKTEAIRKGATATEAACLFEKSSNFCAVLVAKGASK